MSTRPSAETQLRRVKAELNIVRRQLDELLRVFRLRQRDCERLRKTISIFAGTVKDDEPMRAALLLWASELEQIIR